jgi:membrane-associated phospholipid phosphatase
MAKQARVCAWTLTKFFGLILLLKLSNFTVLRRLPQALWVCWECAGLLLVFTLTICTAIMLVHPSWDLAAFFWLNTQGARAPVFAQIITHFADLYWVSPLLILMLASRPRSLASVMCCALLIHLGVSNLKEYFAIMRPCFEPSLLGQVFTAGPSLRTDSFSFPSGHSATAALFAAACIARFGQRALLPSLVLALAVAASRSMLGAHYPSDTSAGLALGSAVALLCFWLQQRFAAWLSGERARRWGIALVSFIALLLLLRIALAPLLQYPGWFKAVSLVGCVLAMGEVVRQVY